MTPFAVSWKVLLYTGTVPAFIGKPKTPDPPWESFEKMGRPLEASPFQVMSSFLRVATFPQFEEAWLFFLLSVGTPEVVLKKQKKQRRTPL